MLLGALLSRLWFLQVLAGDRYAELAESNEVRTVLTEAPRGRILDRNGDELVKNRVALTISADRNRLLDAVGDPKDEQAEEVLDRLSELLELSLRRDRRSHDLGALLAPAAHARSPSTSPPRSSSPSASTPSCSPASSPNGCRCAPTPTATWPPT